MGIIEQRRLIREDVIRKAREFTEKVKNCLGKISVVLVGSYARGDFNEWSDIDILIIAEDISGNPLERMDYLIGKCPPPAGIEPIIISLNEFIRQKKLETPLSREAYNIGMVLADDLRLFRK